MLIELNDQFMIEKKIAYLDRNEYNYGPAPEIGEVRINYVFTPGFTTKVKKVFYPTILLNYTIFRRNKLY